MVSEKARVVQEAGALAVSARARACRDEARALAISGRTRVGMQGMRVGGAITRNGRSFGMQAQAHRPRRLLEEARLSPRLDVPLLQ